MSATVVNGVFVSNGIVYGTTVNVNGLSQGFACVGNTTTQPQTYTGVTITGDTFGIYSVPAGQFPVLVNPGQTAIVEIDVNPDTKGGVGAATATVSTNTAFKPQLSLQALASGVLPQPVFQFPPTKLGQSVTFNNAVLVNGSAAPITVNNLAFNTGTDFFLIGAPIVPFTLPAFGTSAVFGIQFSPTVLGGRADQLIVTEAGLGNTSSTYIGTGSTLQSAFNLTGGTQGSLFAFSGVILLANQNDFNCEEACSAVKLHDFQIPNQEKQVMRICGHYEDLGPAVLTFKCRGRRKGKPDETITVATNIGTVAADGWIREFTSEPTPVTSELVQITLSRTASSGPASVIDYIPQFETVGEVIGGT